jgi:hypothetical protein
MNRKSHFLAVILTVLLVLSGLSPVVNSKEITKNQDKITIQVNQYTAEGINNFLTELNVEDARELQEYLENY